MNNIEKKEFQAILEYNPKDSTLYKNHVKVADEVFQYFKQKNIKRIIFTLNHGNPNHGGFIPVGDGRYFLITSKTLLKENELSVGEQVTVCVWKDTTKYGMPISPELQELLDQDEKGCEMFHKLTEGKIRSLLYKINGYKSSGKRLEKAVIVLEHLKVNGGKLDWKMLNEAFKMGL